MARKILSAMTVALLLAVTPATALAQDDFGGGGGLDYSGDYGGGYDSYGGGYDTSSSGYDTESYGYDNASAYDTSSSPVLSGSDGIDTNDVASGQSAPSDPPVLGNDPWTTGTSPDPYASSTDPWATTASNDPWASTGSTEPAPTTDPWSTNVSSDPYTSTSSDPWATTSTSNDPWTNGTAPDPYASATDPWATTASNDPWASTGSTEPAPGANDGWTSSTSSPDGWTSSAPDGWNSQDAQPALAGRGRPDPLPAVPEDYVPSEQAERVVQLAGGDAAHQRTLQREFDNLPQGIRDEVDGSGSRIVTCDDNVTNARPTLAGQTTGDGRRMEDVGGIFLPRGEGDQRYPTAAVCLVDRGGGRLGYPGTSGSVDVNSHEIVHVVDRAQGYPSRTPEFQQALELDRALARSGQGADGILNPYYSGGGFGYTPTRGAEEAYAEGGARYLRGNDGWPNINRYFASQPIFQRR